MVEAIVTTNVRGSFYLYDIFGRLVEVIEITNESTKIKRGKLNAGMYYYKFLNQSGRLEIVNK